MSENFISTQYFDLTGSLFNSYYTRPTSQLISIFRSLKHIDYSIMWIVEMVSHLEIGIVNTI